MVLLPTSLGKAGCSGNETVSSLSSKFRQLQLLSLVLGIFEVIMSLFYNLMGLHAFICV